MDYKDTDQSTNNLQKHQYFSKLQVTHCPLPPQSIPNQFPLRYNI
jgi:hypothetical protein